MRGFATLLYFELKRSIRKKSFYALVALMVAPLLVALYAHHMLTIVLKERFITEAIIEKFHLDRLWAAILGIESIPLGVASLAPYLLAMHVVSLAGLAWIVAVLYGGDLLAADLRDKLIHLILVRPVRRGEYVAAKILGVLLVLIVLYAVAGVVAFASGWILIGKQAGLLEALAYSALIAVGTLPLLLASAAAGAATKSPTVGFIAGIVAYFVASIVAGVAALAVAGLPTSLESMEKLQKLTVYISAANPFTAGASLAQGLYAMQHNENVMRLVISYASRSGVITVDAARVTTIAGLSLGVSVAVLALLLWLLVARRDL